MASKNIYFYFALLSLVGCSARDECTTPSGHTFITKGIHFFPETESLSIGDTLWVSFDESTHLKTSKGDTVYFPNAANLSTYVGCLYAGISDTDFVYATQYIDFVLEKGKLGSDHKFDYKLREYLMDESNGRYEMKVGLVFKKKGLFSFTNGDAANVYQKGDKTLCTASLFTIPVSNENNHAEKAVTILPKYTSNIELWKNKVYFVRIK